MALLLAFAMPLPGRALGYVIYAKPGGLTTGGCDTWVKRLRSAIRVEHGCNIRRNRSGSWKVPIDPQPARNQTVSFSLKNGVAIYGGFVGTETALNQRNPTSHVTILSGDIGTAGNASDNSYHVVTGIGTDSTAVLDGFTVHGWKRRWKTQNTKRAAGCITTKAAQLLRISSSREIKRAMGRRIIYLTRS